MQLPKIAVSVGLLAMALLLSSCASRQKKIASLSVPRIENTNPATFGGTIGKTEFQRALPRPIMLARMTSEVCGYFDRVVFEFRGNKLPGYKIEYIDEPIRQCASETVLAVAGDAWLEVRLTHAQAHSDAGVPTIRERERLVNYPNIKELQSTCDCEGEVTWVLGVGSPTRYRAFELSNPARLVVDVKHTQ